MDIICILLAIALLIMVLMWTDAIAKRNTYREIADSLINNAVRGQSPKVQPPDIAQPGHHKGPKFEWSDEEGCWVLEDCILIDHDMMWSESPKFRAYANPSLRRPKKK